MENKILTNPMEKPEVNVLENALGKNYKRFTEFVSKIETKNLILEWRYYNDAKSWLGKILNKKKNLCWLSVWDTGFKLTFYFPEKAMAGIHKLEINDEIKKTAKEEKPIGKSHPIIILIASKEKMNNALKILEYKMELK